MSRHSSVRPSRTVLIKRASWGRRLDSNSPKERDAENKTKPDMYTTIFRRTLIGNHSRRALTMRRNRSVKKFMLRSNVKKRWYCPWRIVKSSLIPDKATVAAIVSAASTLRLAKEAKAGCASSAIRYKSCTTKTAMRMLTVCIVQYICKYSREYRETDSSATAPRVCIDQYQNKGE